MPAMSDRPKRPWFRFHLLTAVLMMLATGTLLYANMRTCFEFVPRGEEVYSWSTTARSGTNKVDYILRVRGPGWFYGWPIHIVHYDFKGQKDYQGLTKAWDVDDPGSE